MDWPNLRVLVAEDNQINQMVIVAVLKKFGCQSAISPNGKEVVEAFIAGDYDLILMDCHMPVMDGFEATTEIRKLEARVVSKRAPIPIIAVTASAMKEDHDRCLAAEMDAVLTKPVRANDLKVMIEKVSRTIASRKQTT
ncbi:MAG: response regulator [Verrucomicrobiota bacterium]